MGADAWGDPITTPPRTSTSHASKTSSSSNIPYDDGGEPDFEGWLNAQAAAKQQSKKPLPKGLAPKKPTPKPAGPTSKKTLPSTSKGEPRKAPAPAAEEDDDD